VVSVADLSVWLFVEAVRREVERLVAEDDAERLAAAQTTTAAQLEVVGDADLQRMLGVDAATVEGWPVDEGR